MSRVYLDSNGFAYYFDSDQQFGPAATRILQLARGPGHRLFASLFALSEVLVRPVLEGDESKTAIIKRFFQSSAVALLPYSMEAVPIYASLRANQRVKPTDALHLACAAHAKVDLSLTNDERLQRLTVPGIGTIAPLDTTF